jgi:hypothetical protein
MQNIQIYGQPTEIQRQIYQLGYHRMIWCIILPVGERHEVRDDEMNGGDAVA